MEFHRLPGKSLVVLVAAVIGCLLSLFFLMDGGGNDDDLLPPPGRESLPEGMGLRPRRVGKPGGEAPAAATTINVRVLIEVRFGRHVYRRTPFPWQQVTFRTPSGCEVESVPTGPFTWKVKVTDKPGAFLWAESPGYVSRMLVVSEAAGAGPEVPAEMILKPAARLEVSCPPGMFQDLRIEVRAFEKELLAYSGGRKKVGFVVGATAFFSQSPKALIVLDAPRGIPIKVAIQSSSILQSLKSQLTELTIDGETARIMFPDTELHHLHLKVEGVPEPWLRGQRVFCQPVDSGPVTPHDATIPVELHLDSRGGAHLFCRRMESLHFGLQLADGSTIPLESDRGESVVRIAEKGTLVLRPTGQQELVGIEVIREEGVLERGVVIASPSGFFGGPHDPEGATVALLGGSAKERATMLQVRTAQGDFSCEFRPAGVVAGRALLRGQIRYRPSWFLLKNDNDRDLVFEYRPASGRNVTSHKIKARSELSLRLPWSTSDGREYRWRHKGGWRSPWRPWPQVSGGNDHARFVLKSPRVRSIAVEVRGWAEWPSRQDCLTLQIAGVELVRRSGAGFEAIGVSADDFWNRKVMAQWRGRTGLEELGITALENGREGVLIDLQSSPQIVLRQALTFKVEGAAGMLIWSTHDDPGDHVKFSMLPEFRGAAVASVSLERPLVVRGQRGSFCGLAVDAGSFQFLGWFEGQLDGNRDREIMLPHRVMELESRIRGVADIFVTSSGRRAGHVAGWVGKNLGPGIRDIRVPGDADRVYLVRQGRVLASAAIGRGMGRVVLR